MTHFYLVCCRSKTVAQMAGRRTARADAINGRRPGRTRNTSDDTVDSGITISIADRKKTSSGSSSTRHENSIERGTISAV